MDITPLQTQAWKLPLGITNEAGWLMVTSKQLYCRQGTCSQLYISACSQKQLNLGRLLEE
jgi:hypothetical protein